MNVPLLILLDFISISSKFVAKSKIFKIVLNSLGDYEILLCKFEIKKIYKQFWLKRNSKSQVKIS